MLRNIYRQSPDLFAIVVLALVAVVVAVSGVQNNVVRLVIGLPLVLALPGYALTAAFTERTLGFAARVLLTIGLSVVVSVLGGLFLNLMPAGLETDTWALLISGVTILASIVAWERRGHDAVISQSNARSIIGLRPRDTALFGVALLIAIAAIVVARNDAMTTQDQTAFSQLWLLPSSADANTVEIGLDNAESQTTGYSVQLLVNGSVVKEWTNLTIPGGQNWQTTFVLPAGTRGVVPVEARLYRLDNPGQIYRRVTL